MKKIILLVGFLCLFLSSSAFCDMAWDWFTHWNLTLGLGYPQLVGVKDYNIYSINVVDDFGWPYSFEKDASRDSTFSMGTHLMLRIPVYYDDLLSIGFYMNGLMAGAARISCYTAGGAIQ